MIKHTYNHTFPVGAGTKKYILIFRHDFSLKCSNWIDLYRLAFLNCIHKAVFCIIDQFLYFDHHIILLHYVPLLRIILTSLVISISFMLLQSHPTLTPNTNLWKPTLAYIMQNQSCLLPTHFLTDSKVMQCLIYLISY